MAHEKFHYQTLDQLREKAVELGISLPFADSTEILGTPVCFGPVRLPNTLEEIMPRRGHAEESIRVEGGPLTTSRQ